jgi:type IV pilus assembly protein PilW
MSSIFSPILNGFRLSSEHWLYVTFAAGRMIMLNRFNPNCLQEQVAQATAQHKTVPARLAAQIPACSYRPPSLNWQQGVTLVELMVAMTIGLFLSAGVISLYLGMSSTYRATEGQSEVSENGRFALELIAHDIRHAGYNPNLPPDSPWIEDYIFGWESTKPTVGSWTASTWKADTDSIRLTHAAPEVGCNPPLNNPDACNKPNPVHYIYYIGLDTDGTNLGLRLKKLNPDKNAQGLIPNIVDMQILYATGKRIDEFSRPILDSEYLTADQLSTEDWENVFAVKISLLVKSDNTNIMEEPMTLNFNGASWTAPDKALYRQFHGYATVRNRLP